MSVALVFTSAAAGAVAGLSSVPHCMGMCGPLVAGVCAGPREGVAYQVGRTLSYGSLGGLAGGVVALSVLPLTAKYATLVTSVAMALGLVWAALRLVRGVWRKPIAGEGGGGAALSPSATGAPLSGAVSDGTLVPLRRKAPSDGKDAGRTPASVRRTSRWARLVRPVLASPFLVGVLSALLPCAALINLGLLAGASGSVLAGAVTGVAFATVTGGGLATSAWAGTILRQSRVGSLVVAAVLVLGAGIVSVRAFPQMLGEDARGQAAACHDASLAGVTTSELPTGSTASPTTVFP